MDLPLNPLPKVADRDSRLCSTVFENGGGVAVLREALGKGTLLVWHLQPGNFECVPHSELAFVEGLLHGWNQFNKLQPAGTYAGLFPTLVLMTSTV